MTHNLDGKMNVIKFVSNSTYQSQNIMLFNGELAHRNRSVLGFMKVSLQQFFLSYYQLRVLCMNFPNHNKVIGQFVGCQQLKLNYEIYPLRNG